MMRKGSALLVVLGMLAFMVMSATAFSIYMRQNRLPSSFLRQRIASSFLVKAALAEAMSELDSAIGDQPYPNEWQVDPQDGEKGSWLFSSSTTGNYWRNRVYLGEANAEGVDEKSTISTLCLEGLAYLPPPLVNTVRYWSRRSPSAQWRYLDYDAGRWAFTAVNVSDYLDINSLRANVMRDSSVSNRISLAYRFEDPTHASLDKTRAQAFDTAMNAFRQNATYGRLVSMADYNMAMGSGEVKSPDKGSLTYVSPFCRFILGDGSGPFYGGIQENDILQQTFVTDSWYPYIATNADMLVLSDYVNDDFFSGGKGGAIDASLDGLQKTAKANTPYERIQRRLNLAALAALYDYIDTDDVPVSLAVPTMERTPVLTGLQVDPKDFKVMFKDGKMQDPSVTADGVTKTYTHYWWEFKELTGTINVNLSAVFPFKRSSGISPGSYTAEVVVKGFLTDDPAAFAGRRLDVDFRPTADEWKGKKLKFDDAGYFCAVGSKNMSVPGNILTPEQAVIDVTAIKLDLNLDTPSKRKIFAFKVAEKKDKEGNTLPPDPPEDDAAYMGTVPFAYMGSDGKVKPVSVNSISGSGTELKMVFLAWARIVANDGDDKGMTVDLAPATVADDLALNGIDQKLKGDLTGKLCGSKNPVFPIVSEVAGALTGGKDGTFTASSGPQEFTGASAGLALYCNDPRYNFAPEDWYETSAEGGISGSGWLNGVTAPKGDIFQFVANCGYLQSIGEIQFLPYTGDFGTGGGTFNPVTGSYFNSGKYNGEVQPVSTLANHDFMWQTYWAFGPDRDVANDMYKWGITDTRGGVSISPYSSNDELFMAGLANTPYDWIVADPFNRYDATKIDTLSFNARSSEAPLPWVKLENIADKMREKFRSGQAYETWSEWDPDTSDFFGETISNLHDVDRKFLFSYWRNCYANNQQLYLLFVRAEPTMMMGGSGSDHTPSQLGARAVALVWREPVSTIGSSTGTNPSGNHTHRMRILFYHQFD